MSTALVEQGQQGLARVDEEWSVSRMVEQATKIQQCMSAVMKKDEHYGVIPGTQGRDGKPAKPTLLKPGAEKLCLMFRLCPEYETLRAEQSSTLVSYTVRCTLIHIPTGNRIATGLGSCNSREKKYVRTADKKCPSCGKETIIKGKDEFGGGWLCWAKKGGCNAKFKDGDESIEKQDTGVADPSDLDNTILKMSCKRALVAAVLNGTAASDCFTQDLEDLASAAVEYAPPVPAEKAPAYRVPRSVKAEALADDGKGEVAPQPAEEATVEVKRGKVTSREPIVGDGQLKEIATLMVQSSMTKEQLFADLEKRYGVANPRELSSGQADDWIRVSRKKVEAARTAMESVREYADPIHAEAIKNGWNTNDLTAWLQDIFGTSKTEEMTVEQRSGALALLLAKKISKAKFDEVLQRLVDAGTIEPLSPNALP